MSEPVQTTNDGPVEQNGVAAPADRHDEDSQEDLSTGPIAPGKDALEIQAAKENRFAAAGDTVQGQEPAVNIQ